MRKTIPLWLAVSIALLPSALAQSPLESVMNMFERTLGFLFVGGLGMANFVFWGKFLLWILVFAILVAALNFVKVFENKKNIRVAVAAIVALISVIAMPSSIVRVIFEDYGIVVSFLLLAIPLLAVLYLLEIALPRTMPEKGRAYYGIKAAGYYILGFVITHIGRVAGVSFNPSMREIWSFAAGVSFILFLYNLIRCILGGAEKGEEAPGGGGALTKFFDWLGKKPEEKPEVEVPAEKTPEGQPTLARAIRKVGEDVLKFYSKTREIVHQPGQPLGRPITAAIIDLYRRWRATPEDTTLDTNLNYLYDELAEKMREMRSLAESINDQFEALLGHPDIGKVGEGEHAELARIMNQMARAHAIYTDGLLLFYSQMAQVGRS